MAAASAFGRKLERLSAPPGPVAAPRPPQQEQPEPRSPLAEPRQTAHGTLHVCERLYPEAHRHGRALLAAARQVCPLAVATLALDPDLGQVDPRRMLLFDTETTGLSGGAGTLPFLIGLGWFEGEGLKVEQLFLSRPGEERPMLHRLAERMAEASVLVSYNGKSFDWPLLRTRFVMNRLAPPPPRPHLDLLHCARRVFRYRGGSARLQDIEAEVLGHRRQGDVPGHLIPELYFAYLRGRGAGAMRRVLDHNAWDLLLLAALLGHLAGGFRGAAEAQDPRDALGFAEVAFRAREYGAAETFAQRAAASADRTVASLGLVVAARCRWRAADVRGAVELLERALGLAPPRDAASLHLALAKLYEHRLKDPAAALQHARASAAAESPARHQRRLERLARRLEH
jgi:hypothetical protein